MLNSIIILFIYPSYFLYSGVLLFLFLHFFWKLGEEKIFLVWQVSIIPSKVNLGRDLIFSVDKQRFDFFSLSI